MTALTSFERDGMEALIERVEKATGPDRELDARLYYFTGNFNTVGPLEEFLATDIAKNYTPRFTASIDAALALVEKMLPGHGGQLYWSPKTCVVALERPIKFTLTWSATDMATPAIAILSALLRALTAEASP